MPAHDGPGGRERRTLARDGVQGAIDYTLVRRRGRRGVALRVDSSGLTVSAPLTLPLSQVESAIVESERWVRRKLEIWLLRQVPPQRWEAGATLPFLGESLALDVRLAGRAVVGREGSRLLVGARSLEPEVVRRAVVGWYRRSALSHFTERAHQLARAALLDPPRVMLSSAQARWGSCNSRREVRLSWRLVKAPPPIIDYVICHELAHLRHMNHSPAFWSEVERLCPDHRLLQARLVETDHLYRSF